MGLYSTLEILGRLALLLALWMGLAGMWSLSASPGTAAAFAGSVAVAAGAGAALLAAARRARRRGAASELGPADALAAVTLGWFLAGILGGLPYLFSGVLPSAADAFFESVSGFTTTGATALVEVERLPAAVLLWRSLTQWLGGMGIVMLFVSMAPSLGMGGQLLMRAEFPNPAREKIRPRAAATARHLWALYVAVTAACAVAYRLAGLNWFDAINHAFTTLSTGGFSTRTAGVWEQADVEWVAAAFMFVGGTSFVLQYRLWWLRDWTALRSAAEFWAYLAVALGGSVVAALALLDGEVYGEPLVALRKAAFQVVSLLSTTGYTSASYDRWPPLAAAVLFAVMFVGGMTGSTGGGPKVFRLLVMGKFLSVQLLRVWHPRSVPVLRLGELVLTENLAGAVPAFLFLYMVLWFGGLLAMAAAGLDLVSAATAAVACLGNIGPGFGSVGPAGNYAGVPAAGKVVLAVLMIAGRLEVLGIAALLHPAFWASRAAYRRAALSAAR